MQNLKQRSPAWHEAREGKLTASVFGAAIGISPYMTRQELWRQMTGKAPKFEGNEATAHGERYEDEARFAYECETGLVVQETGFWVHPQHEWLGCSPDGITDAGLVEIKCPYSGQVHREIPAHYMAQVQGQLEIVSLNMQLGRRVCHFWSWTPTDSAKIPVLYNPDYWSWMLPLLQEFWTYVLDDCEPPRLKAKPVYQPRNV